MKKVYKSKWFKTIDQLTDYLTENQPYMVVSVVFSGLSRGYILVYAEMEVDKEMTKYFNKYYNG